MLKIYYVSLYILHNITPTYLFSHTHAHIHDYLGKILLCNKDGFFGSSSSGTGTPVKPNHLEIMGNGSAARSTNGNFSLLLSIQHNFFAPLNHDFKN